MLRITDHTGAVRFEAIEAYREGERRRAVERDYLQAAKDWKASGANLPEPRKPEVRVWQKIMGGLDARARAEAAADMHRKREEHKKSLPQDASQDGSDGATQTGAK